MIIEKSQDGFRATVPCKVNLFLEVLGKRDDGYHSLDTVMMAVSLVDELEITSRTDGQLALSVEFPDGFGQPLADSDFAWRIPEDSSNLIIKALDRLRISLGKSDAGANIRLIKRIPAMAGLGGGSADAAASLVLGIALWGSSNDFEKSKAIASSLGSDVNFFLEGEKNGFWLARCTKRGEVIQPLACFEPLHFVVVHPPVGCGTAEVFKALGPISWQERPETPETLLRTLKLGGPSQSQWGVFNRLETAAMRTTDWIDRTRKRIDRYNHLGQCMSGSGSARFCLCATRDQAEKIVSELRTNGGMRAYYAQSWQSSGIEEQINRVRNES
jgi:4-diphosphocytidyl-2-C-methyl-D-erythritol kinase